MLEKLCRRASFNTKETLKKCMFFVIYPSFALGTCFPVTLLQNNAAIQQSYSAVHDLQG